MAEENVKSTPMEYIFDDGTGEVVDAAAKQKEEIAKEAKKELEDREKAMGEVNTAKEVKAEFHDCSGKALKIKNMTEKLTLDETSDNTLVEGLNEASGDSDVYDELIHKLFDGMHKALMSVDVTKLSLEDVLDAIDEATMHIEDIIYEDEEGIYIEEELDEALPKDLAKAYRSNPYKIGDGNVNYGNIKRKNNVDRYGVLPNYYGADHAVDIDFANSEYKEITPEEAIELRKEGKSDLLRVIYDGQLVTFSPDGKQVYKATKKWSSDSSKYLRKSGKPTLHSTDVPYKDFFNQADKIYMANEKPVDRDLQAKRASNPESRYYVRNGRRFEYSTDGDYNFNGDHLRGGDINDYTLRRIDSLKKDIAKYNNDITKYKNYLADADEKKAAGLNIDEDRYIRVTRDLEWAERNVREDEKRLREYTNELKDAQAYKRNISSKNALQKVFGRFFELKKNIGRAKRDIVDANLELQRVKNNGSPKVAHQREELQRALDNLKALQKRISSLELYLESADEDDAEVIKEVEQKLDTYTAQLNSAQNELDTILRRKKEELESEGEEQLDEAKVISAFDSYKPWSGAVDTFNRIEEAGKLDELEGLIDDLYPEGIDETQLNDILWFEDDWLYDTLGISEESEEDNE